MTADSRDAPPAPPRRAAGLHVRRRHGARAQPRPARPQPRRPPAHRARAHRPRCGVESSPSGSLHRRGHPTATLLLSVMGAFAELERTLIRQREGIALARQRGAYRGRRKSLTDAQDRPPSAPSGNRKPCWPRNSVSAVRPSTSTCATARLKTRLGEVPKYIDQVSLDSAGRQPRNFDSVVHREHAALFRQG